MTLRSPGGVAAVLAGVLAITTVAQTTVARADVLADRDRRSNFANQTRLLDTRAAQQYSNSIRLAPEGSNLVPAALAYTGSYSGPYLQMAREAARLYRVPEGLYLRLVQQESGWRSAAVSPKGAIGLAQIMPGTAAHLNIDATDPQQNLEGGARYLATQYREFGSWPLALAAYNAGPQVVRRYGGIPPYAETRNYVKVIWGS